MAESIEIRNDGALICRSLQIGTVSIDTPFPSEFWGHWFAHDAEEGAGEYLEDLESQIESLTEDLDDCKEGLKEAESRAEEVEGSLASLRDELRAVLAGGDFCDTAVQRLRDALEEAGG